jgi:hypothetical protein
MWRAGHTRRRRQARAPNPCLSSLTASPRSANRPPCLDRIDHSYRMGDDKQLVGPVRRSCRGADRVGDDDTRVRRCWQPANGVRVNVVRRLTGPVVGTPPPRGSPHPARSVEPQPAPPPAAARGGGLRGRRPPRRDCWRFGNCARNSRNRGFSRSLTAHRLKPRCQEHERIAGIFSEPPSTAGPPLTNEPAGNEHIAGARG